MKAAYFYWREITGESLDQLPGTAWIRLSTGKLCMDVGNGYESCVHIVRPGVHSKLPEVKLTEYDLVDKLLSTLGLDEFYSMVTWFSTYLNSSPLMPGTITLPSICNPCFPWDRAHLKLNNLHAIPTTKHLTVDDLYINPWYTSDLPPEVLPTGWTRVDYPDCPDGALNLGLHVGLKDSSAPLKWWLSQNHYMQLSLSPEFLSTAP
ncbi:hypothetical protein B0H13DRAFT_881676 [Mycena leptocephala]|nr:hypothetical protein B0H13DRAFT_881676 [Mycena leptocephala]